MLNSKWQNTDRKILFFWFTLRELGGILLIFQAHTVVYEVKWLNAIIYLLVGMATRANNNQSHITKTT